MEKKKSIILSAVAGLTLVILLVGATYAYFQATGGTGASSNIKVETATTDLLTFNFSKSIAIYADQSNFGQNAGSKSDSTKGTATLTASNSPNIESTTDRYNIYFIIEANDFVYTTSDNKTEILLQVTDPNGNEVTAIDGLVYKDGGFDITTRTGGFLLVPDYDISANRSKTTTQEWNITVTLVNLDTDQSENMGKAFNGKLYMTKDQMSSYELSQIKNMIVTTTYNSIDTSLEVTNGTAEIEKYYFANEKVSSNTTSMLSINKLAVSDVTFVETTNANYKFTNLDANSTYKIYSYAVDKNGIRTNMYETEVKTDKYVIPTVDSVTHSSTLNSIIVNVSASKGSNEVVKYYYSKDNGETYEESTEPSYTFNNLADSAEYKIRIKVEDSEGKFSTIYSENISTVTYTLPSITTVTTTTKYNQITVTTTAKDGTNSVSKYYYSINNGAYVEDTSTHTFAGLNEQTTYTIKVKVVDTNNRESVEYITSAKTDAYKLPTVTITSTDSTSDSITINVTGSDGDGTVTTYYYSKDNGSNYVSSTSSSYTFTGLTSDVTFNVKVYVKDSNGRSSSVVAETIETKHLYDLNIEVANLPTTYGKTGSVTCSSNGATYNQKYNRVEISSINNTYEDCTLVYTESTSKKNLASYITSLAGTTQGTGKVVKEKGYRYEGKNPNNYIWFNNELWRIIGVFDSGSHGQSNTNLVKIMRANSIGGLVWDKSETNNNWTTASLNSLLNGAYYNAQDGTNSGYCYLYSNEVQANCDYRTNGIQDGYRSMIENVTWYLGGYSSCEATAASFYGYERGTIVYDENPTSTTGYIGLMYPSDYGYSVLSSSCARTTKLSDYFITSSCGEQSWIAGNGDEFMLTHDSSDWDKVFYLWSRAELSTMWAYIGYGARPVLYLKADVYYIDGDGSIENPIIIGE